MQAPPYQFEVPHSPSRRHKLVAPYITSAEGLTSPLGRNLTKVWLFHEGPAFPQGSMFSTDRDDLLRSIAPSIIIEDLFENTTMTLCALVTNNPNDSIDEGARELWYMYLASSGG